MKTELIEEQDRLKTKLLSSSLVVANELLYSGRLTNASAKKLESCLEEQASLTLLVQKLATSLLNSMLKKVDPSFISVILPASVEFLSTWNLLVASGEELAKLDLAQPRGKIHTPRINTQVATCNT